MAKSKRKVLQYFWQSPPLNIFPKLKTILVEFNNIKPLKVIQIFRQGLHPTPPPSFGILPKYRATKTNAPKTFGQGWNPQPPSGQ